MREALIITSKLGTFTFDPNVIDSRAKLIVDTVTNQVYNPDRSGLKLKTVADAYQFIREHSIRVLAEIPFTLKPRKGNKS